MIRARAIDVLLRSGVRLGRDHRGRLLSTSVPAELAPLVAELEASLKLAVAGATPTPKVTQDGAVKGKRRHSWHRCNACGAERIARDDGAAQSCNLTPNCTGKLLTYRDPPALELDGRPIPCARDGCTRPATGLTYWHEPLCQSDLTHLTLTLEHRSPTP